MSFFRAVLLLCFVSLSAAFGLFFAGSASSAGKFRGGYAVLSVDSSIEDGVLVERLNAGKSGFAGSPVCESSQWVILDDFGSMEVVPLDKYSARLNSFDPRNDGYAEKLKNVFVRDGKRFVYIPLKAGNFAPSLLDKHFKDMLGDIPFSVDYFGIGKPFALFFIACAASSLAALAVCYVKKNFRRYAASVAALLPVLFPLAFFGASGIAACALFLGFSVLLAEPLNELNAVLLSGAGISKQKRIYKEAVEPYRMHWLFFAVFALSLGVITAFSQLKVLFVLAVFAAVCAVLFLSIRASSLWKGKRRRFTPVLIIRRRVPDFAFCAYMLPFTAAAFLVILLAPFMSGAPVSNGKFYAAVNEQDYFAHLAFQSSFSTRQMGEPSSSYPAYKFDEDGLPSPHKNLNAGADVNFDKFPPFPLKHLTEFFNSVNTTGRLTPSSGFLGGAENLPLLVLLLFIFPGLFLKGNIDFPAEGHFAGLKRFYGKLRRTDINRKKVLVYNSNNSLRLRKDA
jgi:hypothetical protein